MNRVARQQLEARVRRKLLELLGDAASREDAYVSGRFLVDIVRNLSSLRSSFGPGKLNDTDLLRLLRYLVDAGYADHRDNRTHRHEIDGIDDEPLLDVTDYRITPRGMQLLAEAIDVDPMIEDERIR